MMSKENITVTQKFLHCMSDITIWVQNMHETEIAYVNDNDVESNIHKYNRIKPERKHPYKHIWQK